MWTVMKIKNITFTLFFFCFCSVSTAQVSTSDTNTCAIDDEGVKCWGDTDYLFLDVPDLKNPREVSVGNLHGCAIDDEGVKCWGWAYKSKYYDFNFNKYGQLNVPELKNPKQISAGYHHTCAIDDEGVKCWGSNEYGQLNVPELKNPKQISAGYRHNCAIDDEGVKCWGDNSDEVAESYEFPVPPFSTNPRWISAGDGHNCALFDQGLDCWPLMYEPDDLKNPRQVSMARNHTCAIDDDGLTCWGDKLFDYWSQNMPDLKNPRQVSTAWNHICVVDDEGVKCWGWQWNGDPLPDDNSLIDVPELSYFSAHLHLVIESSLYSKSIFLKLSDEKLHTKSNETLVSDLNKSGKLLFMSIFYPLVLGTDSDYFKTVVIPKWNNYVTWLKSKTNIPLNHDPLPTIEGTLENRTLALTAIQSSLDVSLSFLSGKQIDRTQDALRKVGHAMIDPMNDQNILEAVKSVESLKEEREFLLSSEKSKFLIECQQVAIDWLKLKVK